MVKVSSVATDGHQHGRVGSWDFAGRVGGRGDGGRTRQQTCIGKHLTAANCLYRPIYLASPPFQHRGSGPAGTPLRDCRPPDLSAHPALQSLATPLVKLQNATGHSRPWWRSRRRHRNETPHACVKWGGSVPVAHRLLIRRLQSVQNAAARFIFRHRRFDHMTRRARQSPLVTSAGRIVFKVAVQTYRGRCTVMLMQYLRQLQFTPIADIDQDSVSVPSPPIICLFLLLEFLFLDVAPFLLLMLVYGTIYLIVAVYI